MDLPYEQLPEYPQDYGPGNVVSRMVDGLGYRYYWATAGLTPFDLEYRPSEDGRTCMETLKHIYGLSETVLNSVNSEPNIRPYAIPEHSFEELRKLTLENLKQASGFLLDKTEADMEAVKIIFQRGERQSEFPFWHLMNGPLADALYHTGQVVIFRRASGNPMDSKVNVFTGKNHQ